MAQQQGSRRATDGALKAGSKSPECRQASCPVALHHPTSYCHLWPWRPWPRPPFAAWVRGCCRRRRRPSWPCPPRSPSSWPWASASPWACRRPPPWRRAAPLPRHTVHASLGRALAGLGGRAGALNKVSSQITALLALCAALQGCQRPAGRSGAAGGSGSRVSGAARSLQAIADGPIESMPALIQCIRPLPALPSPRPAQSRQQQSLPRTRQSSNRWKMSAPAVAAGDGGAAQAVEAGRPAAAAGGHPAAAGAAEGDGGQQQQHYNEVADNYEAGERRRVGDVRWQCSGRWLQAMALPGMHPPRPCNCFSSGHLSLSACLLFLAHCAAFFYSSEEYRDWVLSHLLRHFGLPDEASQRSAGGEEGSGMAWH